MEIMVFDWVVYGFLALLVAAFFSAAVKIFREYERGVVFTLGRFTRVCGPGLVILIPIVQQVVRADLRTHVEDVPPQDVISRDNVSVKVNAVLYYRVIDPERAIINVENFNAATSQLAQTTLRSVLGKHELDEMLAERDRLNADLQEILDRQTDAWGIKVANVEIKHVDLNESMIRAIAKQAEAERLRRARVINAEGEQQAAAKLVEAAEMLARQPSAMQLRYFTALNDIANDRISTIVFPLPMDCSARSPAARATAADRSAPVGARRRAAATSATTAPAFQRGLGHVGELIRARLQGGERVGHAGVDVVDRRLGDGRPPLHAFGERVPDAGHQRRVQRLAVARLDLEAPARLRLRRQPADDRGRERRDQLEKMRRERRQKCVDVHAGQLLRVAASQEGT